MTTETEDHYICPGCGAEVRVGSSGCPKCSPPREREDWEQDEAYDGLDLPDEDDFDYESFVAEEFGGGQKRSTKDIVYLVAGVILLAALLFWWVL